MKILRSAVGSLVSLGLIKELQKHDIEIIGMDSDELAFGKFYLKKFFSVPNADNDDFIDSILEILKIVKPDALLPGPDAEIYELALYKDKIEEHGTLLMCPDFYSVDVCVDKFKTYRYFEGANIPYPKLYTNKTLIFPLFIKPRFGSGSKEVYKINTRREFIERYGNLYNGIIQEYTKGKEYSVDVLGDKNGNILCCVPRLRLKISNGLSITGKTVYHRKIIKYCEQIVKDLKLFGPSCIQCIETEDGDLKFLEINNRFGGGAILSIKACPDFIISLIKLINREQTVRFVPSKFKENLIMTRNFIEVFAEISNDEI